MAKFLTDFKEFALRGNVIDMAVGVVIGAAFGAIVTAMVDGVIMPCVGWLTGGIDFSEYKLVIQQGVMNGTEVVTPELAITWGSLIQTIINFIIVAFCIFLAIKFVAKMQRQKKAEEAAAPAGPTQEELLVEIRDLLAKQQK